jgi:hypothetical protein
MKGRAIVAVLAAVTVTAGLAAGLAGVLAGGAAVASGPGTARAVPPPSSLSWHAPVRADGTGLGDVVAVSCPAPSFCAAFDSAGYWVKWDGSKWTAPVNLVSVSSVDNPAVLDATCVTPTFCVAVGEGIWVDSGGKVTTSQQAPEYPFEAVSCASTSFCVAFGDPGEVTMYNGHSWGGAPGLGDNASLGGISCVSAKFCDALGPGGSVVTWNGTGWATTDPHLMPAGTDGGVTCASAKFCVAWDAYGRVYTFNGSAWSGPGTVGRGDATNDVACTSPAFCVAVTGTGPVEYNGSTWFAWPQPGLTIPSQAALVACSPGSARSRDCAVIGQNGYASTLRSGKWTGQVSVDVRDGLTSIVCPAPGFCVALGMLGDVVTYAGGRWRAPMPLLPGGSFVSVSCPSARFCLADGTTASGALRMWRYDGTRWKPTPTPTYHPGRMLSSVSCASAAFCMWVSPVGISAFNGSAWTSPAPVDKVQWTSVSCATTRFCVAGNGNGEVATYNGKTWSGLRHIGVTAVSCPSTRFCGGVGPAGAATFNGTTWTRTPDLDDLWLGAVSCTRGGFCAALGVTATSGGRDANTLNGSQWSRPVLLFTLEVADDVDSAISCATPTFCVATDTYGLVRVGT